MAFDSEWMGTGSTLQQASWWQTAAVPTPGAPAGPSGPRTLGWERLAVGSLRSPAYPGAEEHSQGIAVSRSAAVIGTTLHDSARSGEDATRICANCEGGDRLL